MAKILVTGGTGTLGTPLVSTLKNLGNEVFTCNPFHMADKNHIRCDVSEFRETEKLFESLSIEYSKFNIKFLILRFLENLNTHEIETYIQQ